MKKRRRPAKPKHCGSILAALLFTLLCGALCLTLLTHSIGHQRIMAIRRGHAAALLGLEDHLGLEIHHIFDTLNLADLNSFDDPVQELFSKDTFPDRTSGPARLRHDFRIFRSTTGGLERIKAFARIFATQIRGPYTMEAEIQGTFLAGSIPTQIIPFLLKAEVTAGISSRDWLHSQGVQVASTVVPLVKPEDFNLDLKRLTQRSLDLGDLELTWSEIRRKLGLPALEAPPPDGIYLVRDPECVHAILVQGDLDQLEFSSYPAYQCIRLTRGNTTLHMEYEPKGTIIDCWIPDPLSTTVFAECIVINGNCRSVATCRDQDENAKAFHPDSHILLLASGRVTVTSSLEREGLGIRRIPAPGISIVCGKSGALNAGGEGIQLSGPDGIALDASLITTGVLSNGDGAVQVNGSICAGGLDNTGEIKFTFVPGGQPLLQNLTVHNLRMIQGIQVLRIEEVRQDDNE